MNVYVYLSLDSFIFFNNSDNFLRDNLASSTVILVFIIFTFSIVIKATCFYYT